MILLIQIILFHSISFSGLPEDKIKYDAISYLEVFETAGIYQFGNVSPVLISDIKRDILNAEFILVRDDVFSKNPNKSRRSAFYQANIIDPRIIINEMNPPGPELIVHEILQDQHYEFSIAMSSLHEELSKERSDPQTVGRYIKSANFLFDNYDIKSKYLEAWIFLDEYPASLINFHTNNSILTADDGEGGDVSGGGGDQYSFSLKKDILQHVLQKIELELNKESHNMSPREIEEFLVDSYVSLLRSIYIETDYEKSVKTVEFSVISAISTHFGFASSFGMVPKFIKIPVNMDRNAATQEISAVIFQTMFGFMPFVNEYFFSNCSCINDRGELINVVNRCPNQRMHVSTYEAVQFIKKYIEDDSQCKIYFKP